MPPAERIESEPERPTFGQRLTGWWFRIFQLGLCYAPAWLAYSVADALAPVLVVWTRRHERRVAPQGRGLVRNQRIVFRERWNEAFAEQHVRAWAKHMTHCLVDFCRMPRLTAENIHESVDLSEFAVLDALLAEGRGAICATGHFGLWELCGHAASVRGMPVTTVIRPLRNPALDAEFRRIRQSSGQRLISKWGAVKGILRTLAACQPLGIAVDENAEQNPVFVPFLGTLAATNATVATLAAKTGAPILVVSCNRIARGRFKFHAWEVIRVPRSRPTAADIEGIMTRVNAALGRALETYPEQWLWGTRRFRTRPPGEQPLPDGLPPVAH